MARWLVKLEGDTEDLRDLSHWLPSGECVVIFEDDCAFMIDAAFAQQVEHRRVFEIATDVCTQLTGAAAQVMHVIEKPVKPSTVYLEHDDGHREGRGFLNSELFVTYRVKRPLPDGNGPTGMQTVLAESRSSPHLRAAIEVCSAMPQTWGRLYCALEEVEQYLGVSADASGLCTSGERERFKRTANSAEVAGIEARHRLSKFEAPENPMELHEAASLIRRLIERAAIQHAAKKSAA